MRTRVYNKMTAREVEDYLARGGDTMYVAVGVVEVHGTLPIDCETAIPEAYAIAMAEKADGLAMINLPYFYPGGTVISNATVHLTIRDGIDYLMKIAHSLVDQGFRRLYFLSSHGPAAMTINAFCREFFEETLIHPCHISVGNIMMLTNDKGDFGPSSLDEVTYGAYKLLGQLDYVPIYPDGEEVNAERVPVDPAMTSFMNIYRKYAGYGATAQIFSDPSQHGGGLIFHSREELEKVAESGLERIYEQVSQAKVCELNEALSDYQAYVKTVAEKFPRIKRSNGN